MSRLFFSSENKNKIEYRLLQILLGVLRVNIETQYLVETSFVHTIFFYIYSKPKVICHFLLIKNIVLLRSGCKKKSSVFYG